ncbi:hypothetical protein [Paraburkholderia saeva]|uniref:Uncharacterized protein n=1 Tax=Paraburkholderia saeva TaxID=2777537 RepID=A0A9N8RX67_9BURK|nr:hypothetical protein [Paraburkholderia saeva]CAG4900704.1 hypothetical protein LMG31841_02908 [Paraburkholderia saeva]
MSQGASFQFVDPTGFARQLQGQFIAGKYAAVTLNSASGTTPQTVLTVPAGKYGFIWGVQITTDPIATISSAGMLNTALNTVNGGETVALLRGYFPSTPASPTQPTVLRQTSAPGAFFACAQPGDTIQCANSVALTAGSIRVSFNYGFSNVPIGN